MQVNSHHAASPARHALKHLGFQGFALLALAGACVVSPAYASPSTAVTDPKAAHAAPAAAAAENNIAAPANPVRPGLAGSFLSGRFARQNQDLREAARYLNETLAHDPNNEALLHEAMRMNLLAGNIDQAIKLAKTLAERGNNDPVIASLRMLEAVKAKDFAAAHARIEEAPAIGLFGLIRPMMLEWISLARGEKKTVVDLQSTIDKAGFFAPFIQYHTALMNDTIGNRAAAKAAYLKTSIDPAITPFRVVEAVANFYARENQIDEAKAVFAAYAKANPQSTLVADVLEVTANPAPLVADAQQGLAELFFTTASILFGEDATQDTFLYLRIALELRPDLDPAQLMLASLYEKVEDYANAIATYDTIPEASPFYRRAQVRKALNYEALNDRAKALALLDTLAKRFPKDPTPLITKGDMERDAKQYSQAAQTYGVAIARTEPLSANDWPLLYARGISYERAGEWDKAEADLKRALVLEPEQPDVLNYLAYSWLTMNKNLTKAREYLEIASAQRPNDAHIVDSVGWAYYLSGDFAAAVTHFERAINARPDDATINEHLGDAYWRVGRLTEAKYQWERALSNKPEQDVVESLKTKLASGLPAFIPPTERTPAKVAKTPATTQVH